jgi:acetyl esterase
MIDNELHPFLEMWNKAWSALPQNAHARERRALIERLSDEARQPLPADIAKEERHVPHGDGSVRVVIFRRKATRGTPCLVYMHGGGWLQGSPETHDAITIGIAQQAGYTVISVDYALAPEFPFPAAIKECETVVRWAFANAPELDIDAAQISVGGDSAGGNLAAALTLIFRDSFPALKGQLLFYPAVDSEQARPSYRENADGPIITTATMRPTLLQYCPNEADLKNPLVAPLLAPDHTGLPPAFIAVAEHDPLRDDGIAYAERLRAGGVPVQLDRGTSLIHGYLRAMSFSTKARGGFAGACAWLRELASDRGSQLKMASSSR